MGSYWKALAAGFLVVILLISELAGVAAASSGGIFTLPPPRTSVPNRSGLTISIDTVWLPTNGYRPVKITITPIVPPTSDRTLRIRLTPFGQNYQAQYSTVQVTRTIELPAGSTGVTVTVPVPQWNAWRSLQFDTFEDGSRIDELSSGDVLINNDVRNGSVSTFGAPPVGRLPAILLLGASSSDASLVQGRVNLPDSVGVFGVLRLSEFLAAGATNTPGTIPTNDPSIASLAELPDQWLGFSGVDIVLVSLDKLDELVKNQPKQWVALRNMVATGGNLCVYGVGDQWARLAELETLIDLSPQVPDSGDAANKNSIRGWKKPEAKDEEPPLPPNQRFPEDTSRANVPAEKAASSQPPPFVSHALGRGQVIAIGAADVFTDAKFDWNRLLHTIGENRWQWAARSGVVLDPNELGSNASNFWQFLIPGVGLTPVLQFQILISLFVIAIGPVNYLLLRRWQRLNLLPITVGVSAAVVTLTLFAYAFVHDGLGVRVRARSFTELDQRRGEAVCWSRLSYYAGLSPSRGLTFSGDMAVYPLRANMEQPRSRIREMPPPREMEWVAAEPNAADPLPSQHFSSDWLPARVPTQFVAVRARKTAARLNVTTSRSQGAASKIENRLGGRIRWLVLTDAAGQTFEAENVNDEESAEVKEVESSVAQSRIATRIMENDLQYPVGAQGNWFQATQNYSPYSGNWTGSNGPTPTPVENETILERSLHHASDLPPRSFVAIMETSAEVELGTTSAHEESSLHVIVGKW